MKAKPWNEKELDAICQAYAYIYVQELHGTKVNKAAVCRTFLEAINDSRTRGSYEMKMCNISAALNDQGLPYIKGYKPRSGYQRVLKEMIGNYIAAASKYFKEGVTDDWSKPAPRVMTGTR
jgi:hypothetical protein